MCYLTNGMKIWKENRKTTTLLFLLKRLEIVHQERRGQVKTMVMVHFNGILFNKSEPANKQNTNQPNMCCLIIFSNDACDLIYCLSINNVFELIYSLCIKYIIYLKG